MFSFIQTESRGSLPPPPRRPRDSTAFCLSADSSPQGVDHLIISSDVVARGEAQTTGLLAPPGAPTMEQIGVPLFWQHLQAPNPIRVPQPRLSALKTDWLTEKGAGKGPRATLLAAGRLCG